MNTQALQTVGFAALMVAGLALAAAGAAAQTPAPAPSPNDINGIYVLPNGDVGIGTKAPQADLHVRGNLHAEGRVTGVGFGDRYPGSPLLNAYNTLGSPAALVFVFDELNYGKTPQAIQIMNPEANVFKTFVIDHPVDPARYLVHATLEGPEGAVYYRGSARLRDGRATIALPPYFEALTKEERRTIQLTNVGGFDALAVQPSDGRRIAEGRFTVISNNPASTQAFDWEVKAVRKDKPALLVQPLKGEAIVAGYGPYKIAVRRGPDR